VVFFSTAPDLVTVLLAGAPVSNRTGERAVGDGYERDLLSLLVSCKQIRPVEGFVAARITTWIAWVLVAQLVASSKHAIGQRPDPAVSPQCSDRCSDWCHLFCLSPQMLGPRKSLALSAFPGSSLRAQGRQTFAGLQISQVCTGTPFLALLTRPVMGVSLMVMSPIVGLGIGLMGPEGPIDEEEAADP
jgi:hypothetical protein